MSSKPPQGPVGALSLLGVGIALMLDQGELAHSRTGLPQPDAAPLGEPDQDLAGAIEQPRIGREHHVFGPHRGVDDDALEVGRFDRVGLGGDRKALLEQGLQPLLAHALASASARSDRTPDRAGGTPRRGRTGDRGSAPSARTTLHRRGRGCA